MIRLLMDQGLLRSSARLLRDAGWDMLDVGDIAMGRSSDSDIPDYARHEQRICVTFDADFHAQLAVSGAACPSTIRMRIEGLKGSALAEPLKRVWPMMGDALESGAMATIAERNIHLHRLPIGRGDAQ